MNDSILDIDTSPPPEDRWPHDVRLASKILKRFPDDEFAIGMLEDITQKLRITDNQYDYIFGIHNPQGKNTFQQRCGVYNL